MGSGLQLREQLIAPAELGQGGAETGLAQRRPQRAGQVALGKLVRLTGGPRVVRRTSAASRAARAVSTRACRRSILPARQDT